MTDKIDVEGKFRYHQDRHGRYIFTQFENFNHVIGEEAYRYFTNTRVYNNDVGDLVFDGHLIRGINARNFFPEEFILESNKYSFNIKYQKGLDYLYDQEFTNRLAIIGLFNRQKRYIKRSWNWKKFKFEPKQEYISLSNDAFITLDEENTIYKHIVISDSYEVLLKKSI